MGERNLKIKKYISEIIYSPKEIKIYINYSSLLDSSTSLSTMMGDRRHDTDESRVVENLRAEVPRINVGTCEQVMEGFTGLPQGEGFDSVRKDNVGSPEKTRTSNLVVTVILALLLGLDYLITIAFYSLRYQALPLYICKEYDFSV